MSGTPKSRCEAGCFMRRWYRGQSEESESQVKTGEKDGDLRQQQTSKEHSLVVPDGRKSRRKRTGGGRNSDVAEVQKWEAERVARYVTD